MFCLAQFDNLLGIISRLIFVSRNNVVRMNTLNEIVFSGTRRKEKGSRGNIEINKKKWPLRPTMR